MDPNKAPLPPTDDSVPRQIYTEDQTPPTTGQDDDGQEEAAVADQLGRE